MTATAKSLDAWSLSKTVCAVRGPAGVVAGPRWPTEMSPEPVRTCTSAPTTRATEMSPLPVLTTSPPWTVAARSKSPDEADVAFSVPIRPRPIETSPDPAPVIATVSASMLPIDRSPDP